MTTLLLSNGSKIEFTRVNNDVNGNPRYVCHFSNVVTDDDREKAKSNAHYLDNLYTVALARAKKYGGRKFHNKQYGGGIVFQSYNLGELKPLFENL